ncbi:McrB family protein [Vibrio cyclitrophicus]|uniref:McrB family protein n=1 Tax=Vibrio cyclitrophicus TaxID=47951 RepID=UPI000309389E|nr:AAA family ATPase [Vibrio cyclitrophicus]OED68632.1 restriction endonuclease [Vibrio cyclitrophicus ZF99]PME23806.1 restriction endonuclease [Vibrio cyclitrophicus]
MDDNKLLYDKNYAKQLDDNDLYKCLYDAWKVQNEIIQVWGSLEGNAARTWFSLKQVKLIDTGEPIEYPLPNNNDLQAGVFLHPATAQALLNGKESALVKGELKLASVNNRKNKDNPFLVSLVPSSVEVVTELPKFSTDDIMQSDLTTLVSENVYRHFLSNLESKTAVDEEKAQAKLTRLDVTYSERQKILDTQFDEINSKVEGLNVKRDSLLDKLKDLEKLQYTVKANIEQEKSTLNLIIEKQQQIEDEMSKKIELLKQYVEEKASFLRDFEFIDEDVYAELSGIKPDSSEHSSGLNFVDDFGSDYSKLTSYLQAYLKEQGQYYSRHIVENYLTLIRTNDLVILAGDSGSGKTSLVQSFAQAVGGVAKIIPVKPNWTSSEDLLGYYNPLEKKYLATPFLEALLEANQNPTVPYFICLDEMNLARVEYYFADFLSKLEERKQQPEIQLYSDDEATHVLSELRGVVSIISGAREKYNKNGIVDFVAQMQDDEINAEMKRAFGFSDKDSLIKYHGDVRRMLSGVLGTPSTITIPSNVRIVGAINIDETTHYLSPKILDRAHIMKFKSPLLTDWNAIEQEIENYNLDDVSKSVRLSIDELGVREQYPNFSPSDEFCRQFTDFNREHFHPLGVEFGMRTIRQGLNYVALYREVNPNDLLALNNFLLHKVLPKFTFDGSKPMGNTDKLTHIERVFLTQVEEQLHGLVVTEEFSVTEAIKEIIETAKANDDVVNYWA